ncbi:prolyl-tRNA synthetase associated domain-containing protein [Enterococcus sp. LJL51]|uniref:prolyl-tRNA synthetase associated domain-containing protein n=1 Tax=Enterococcus sp. LJL51 TaxID=3416656 RepID=UPI003CFAC3F5
MDQYRKVASVLKDMNIAFEIVEHPPVFTTEEADSYIVGIPGVRTKSMFLTNKKKTAYYLLIMDDSKRVDMNKFKEMVGETRIKMASSESLMEQMQLSPGSVSIFGLLNNKQKNIQVFFDQAILSEKRMSFHPNMNTKTIFLDTCAVLTFVKETGFDYTAIDL